MLDRLAGLAGLALAGNDNGLDAEVFQFGVAGGLAVATVGGCLLRDAAEAFADAPDRWGELFGVGRVAGLDVVIEHEPVFVVDDLGLVAELDGLAEPALLDRPGVGVVQADQPGGRIDLVPATRVRVCATTCAARPASVDSALIALCSLPRGRPIVRPRARRALASTAAASTRARCARSASSPVSRSTVACASCLASAVRSFSFAPIACTLVVAVSLASRNTVRVAPPAALIRPTSLPISVTAWVSSPESVGYSTLPDTTVVSARTFPVFTNFAASARASGASLSPATTSSPHLVVIFDRVDGAGTASSRLSRQKIRHEIESDTSRHSDSYPNRYRNFRNIIRR